MMFGKLFKKPSKLGVPEKLPRHLGIIMDGNGRWAKRRGLPRSAGHAAGAETFKKIVNICGEMGIAYLTVYAFSTENWNRSPEEVEALMRLLAEYLDRAYEELNGKNVKVNIIGERYMLSDELLKRIEKLEEDMKDNTGLVLNIALSYGGRQEIVNAAKKAAEMVKRGEISEEEIDEKLLSSLMYTATQPDPDLIIRPSGEYRTSNFLLWQSAYSELWFSHVLWPAFSKRHLLEALNNYAERNRRFGR